MSESVIFEMIQDRLISDIQSGSLDDSIHRLERVMGGVSNAWGVTTNAAGKSWLKTDSGSLELTRHYLSSEDIDLIYAAKIHQQLLIAVMVSIKKEGALEAAFNLGHEIGTRKEASDRFNIFREGF